MMLGRRKNGVICSQGRRKITRWLQQQWMSSMRLISGACDLPHPQKKSTGGEDAWFICSNTVGVADGVGGWARKGIDSGEYSRTLMNAAHAALGQLKSPSQSMPTPLEVLQYAHERAKCLGSSTACIVQLDELTLRTINLGDSGFLVCRLESDGMDEQGKHVKKWKVIYESPHQCHYFNCPFQLGVDGGDLPEQGQMEEFDAQVGDLVVLATDGLFDNLFPTQIASLLDTVLPTVDDQDPRTMERVASCVAHTAHECAKSSKLKTPFAQAARKAGFDYLGGKMDDITVITSLVSTRE